VAAAVRLAVAELQRAVVTLEATIAFAAAVGLVARGFAMTVARLG
jgi:hypothetical protein